MEQNEKHLWYTLTAQLRTLRDDVLQQVEDAQKQPATERLVDPDPLPNCAEVAGALAEAQLLVSRIAGVRDRQ